MLRATPWTFLSFCAEFRTQDRDSSGGIEWNEFVALLVAFAHDNMQGASR